MLHSVGVSSSAHRSLAATVLIALPTISGISLLLRVTPSTLRFLHLLLPFAALCSQSFHPSPSTASTYRSLWLRVAFQARQR